MCSDVGEEAGYPLVQPLLGRGLFDCVTGSGDQVRERVHMGAQPLPGVHQGLPVDRGGDVLVFGRVQGEGGLLETVPELGDGLPVEVRGKVVVISAGSMLVIALPPRQRRQTYPLLISECQR